MVLMTQRVCFWRKNNNVICVVSLALIAFIILLNCNINYISLYMHRLDEIVVSICCVTYNHEHYIRDAIDGFLSQVVNFKYEIIIHDDASGDSTAKIIREYEDRYPDLFRCIYQSLNQYSLGKKPFQSYVAPYARGKYIAFCEGDDYWTDPYKLQKQIDFLEENVDYVICYADAITRVGDKFIYDINEGCTHDLESEELKQSPNINTLTVCFRNIFQSQPEFALAKYEDRVMWSYLGNYGKGKYLSCIKPSVYRAHNNGIHSSASIDQRCKMEFVTYVALYVYYDRINNDELKSFFFKMLTESLFCYYKISPRLISVMRYITSVGRFIFAKMRKANMLLRRLMCN